MNDPAATLLGYLNFSSGAFDPAAWRAMNALYAVVEPAVPDGIAERADAAGSVVGLLRDRLERLEREGGAFRDSAQARRTIGLLFEHLLPAYRRFHCDLLEHQPPGALERPFFLLAAAQALLAEGCGTDSQEDSDLVERAIQRLNEYVGWRPVAVLENGRLSEPYPHERVRPIPVFIAGVGPAHGRYRDAVGTAVEILERAPPALLRQADFDPALLEEIAIDPRAFDFLHPAASRPNYLFGLWDPLRIDDSGSYRRMVVQQVTLEGILSWPQAAAARATPAAGLDAETRWESAAVLAGVVLMAAGLSGHGPGSRQAALPLSELLPRIAGYRDEFYRWLLTSLPAAHRRRLEEEAARMRQPFGGVRRHINSVLSGQRARQVESVALASVFARLGRAAAAERLASRVPAASARMLARITGRVVAARRHLRSAPPDRDGALGELDAAGDLLLRAVACGATVDPWNILGMAGQFPLHEPGGESLPDPRVDDLVVTTESILDGYAAVWRGSDLNGAEDQAARAEKGLVRLGRWWDRFATTSVSGVPHLSGQEVAASSREVVAALKRRRALKRPPTASFWGREVAGFSSPRTHAEAADALLREGDLDGAGGLIVHWASLLEREAIERSGPTWMAAAGRWIELALADATTEGRTRVRRFLERVEANLAGVIDLVEAAAVGREPGGDRDLHEEPDEDGDAEFDDEQPGADRSVAAAYESMVWHDSTDDGVDGGMLDLDSPGGNGAGGAVALQEAAELTMSFCRLVVQSVTAWCAIDAPAGRRASPEDAEAAAGWRRALRRLRRSLTRAAEKVVDRDREPLPGMSPTEFDRIRWQRDAAAERLVEAAVMAGEACWVLAAHRRVGRRPRSAQRPKASIGRLLAAAFAGDPPQVVAELALIRRSVAEKPVLYVPLSRGGRPHRIVRARSRERMLERLVACLPRLGLVAETIRLVQLAKSLENRRPAGAASVSEFDHVFEVATGSLVERIVLSAGIGDPAATAAGDSGRAPASPPRGRKRKAGSGSPAAAEASPTDPPGRILAGLSCLEPQLLETWMTHARQLRLSVLERCRDERTFGLVREFVERYGSGLFTQHMLAPPSLRGILRGGVRRHLERLAEQDQFEPDAGTAARRPQRLLADLASGALPLRQAAARVRMVLESVAENHAEYRDWNSTTTQSDRGECLHILLDFLRVKAEYDRIAWTLRPVNMAHRVLARQGAAAAAAAWRKRMTEETSETAAGLVARLDALEAQWSVRLASVSDRVRRPFSATLELDELESLVEPAVSELVAAEPGGAGQRLEAKAESFLGVASGSGVEVPDWLERLGAAVDRALERQEAGGRGPAAETRDLGSWTAAIPWLPIPWEAVHTQLSQRSF